VCGAVSVAAQFALARVTLSSLSGNEFGAGLFLGFWLLFGGAGCLLFPVIARGRRETQRIFILLLCVLALLAPASCYGIALARRILFGLSYSLSLGRTLALASLASFPVAFAVGSLFGAALQAAPNGRKAATGLYIADAVGSFAGGLLASFLLAPLLPTIAIALLASAVALLTAAFVSLSQKKSAVPAAALAIAGVFAAALVAVPAGRNAALIALSRARYPAGEIAVAVDSRFQGFAAVRSRESISFYQNGVLTFFSQAGEREEEIAHIALLSRPAPSSVLVVGNGWPFLPREILKHPVRSVELAVEDEKVHGAGIAVLPAELSRFLSDPRLRVRYGDPQAVPRGTGERFSAVFIDTGTPETLLSARLYTREFFRRLQGMVEENGIVVLAVPSLESRLSPALLSLHASILATLRAEFGNAIAVRGEYAGDIIIAGRDIAASEFEPGRLAGVLEGRGITAKWINRHSLSTILDPRNQETLERQLDKAGGTLNTRENPVLILFSLQYREELSGGRLALSFLRGFSFWEAAAGLLVLALALIAMDRLFRRDVVMPGCAAAAGFSGMIAELSLLGVFQLVVGSLYAGMAGLIGIFMAGMAVGSAAAPALAGRMRKRKDDGLLAAALCVGLGCAVAVASIAPVLMASSRAVFLSFLFLAMAISGFCSGSGVSLLLWRRQAMGAAGETIYGADLLGGAIGGACASIILLPVLGTGRSLWFAAMGYGFAVLLLVGRRSLGIPAGRVRIVRP
jgi:predicted membrane-bound spermidine synthase